MEKIGYYLILEKRLGDYNLIDINKLDICQNYVSNDLAAIDSFTCRFSEAEIKASIERSNIAHLNYMDGALKVISDVKHNLKALTKDIFTSVIQFQNNEEEIDREYKNKLFGIYRKVIENTFDDKDFIQGLLNRFKDSLKASNKPQIFSIIEELPYNKSRNIYFTIYNEENKRKQEKFRKLEKLNDVA